MFHRAVRISCADWVVLLEEEEEVVVLLFEGVEEGLGIGGTVCAFGEI